MLSRIFTPALIYATIRSATPILYAALCASITQQANILNIGTEGIMLMGAFFGVAISYLTGSWLLAVLVAMLSGAAMAMIIAVGHIRYQADNCAIGMGVNLFAVAMTKFLLNSVLGKNGTFTDPNLAGIPKLHLGFLSGSSFLNTVLNDWSITEWFVIVLILLVSFLFYKTAWGLRLRAVGRMQQAAQTAGINVNSMKYQAILIAGLIGGLAGAHLSLGYLTKFTEGMSASRGFIAVACVIFGSSDPRRAFLAALLFGFIDALGMRIQDFHVDSNLTTLAPYLVTVVMMVIVVLRREHRKKKLAR